MDMAHQQYVSTIESNDDTVIVTSNRVDVQLQLGQARDQFLLDLLSVNEHFRISVHANFQNQQIIAVSDGNTTAVLARLQRQNLIETGIMLYGNIYIQTNTQRFFILLHS
ncbi:hypothetical protein I4U23_012647 [Adineta vaga]|nr:hypothetical protein I4U23_012647 [Adineta vaga]